jgi:hypothetical protein
MFWDKDREGSHLKPTQMIEIGEKAILRCVMKSHSRYRYYDFIIVSVIKGGGTRLVAPAMVFSLYPKQGKPGNRSRAIGSSPRSLRV